MSDREFAHRLASHVQVGWRVVSIGYGMIRLDHPGGTAGIHNPGQRRFRLVSSQRP